MTSEGTIKEEVLREVAKNWFTTKEALDSFIESMNKNEFKYECMFCGDNINKVIDLAIQKTLAKAEKIIDGEKASWERFYEKKASHLNVTLNAIIRSLDLAKQRISEIGGDKNV